MKLIFDNDNQVEIFLDSLVESDYCPSQAGLKDATNCKAASCRECWENALKEGVVHVEKQ